MPGITLIAALDEAGAIGKAGQLPWKLLSDLAHFKKTTLGHAVVMGRKTYDSLPDKYRPLPERENIILSRDGTLGYPGCGVVNSPELILKMAKEREIFVIGGAEIYRLFHKHALRMILTHVKTVVKGTDAFFPPIPIGWQTMLIMEQLADARNDYAFSIIEYKKP